MSPEDKELLLKDLCSRVPFVVWCYYPNGTGAYGPLSGVVGEKCYFFGSDSYNVENVKPLLRPLSDMTEEEKEEIKKDYLVSFLGNRIRLYYHSEGYWDNDLTPDNKDYTDLLDWLKAHHFDHRGLISKGLAIDITTMGFYPYA